MKWIVNFSALAGLTAAVVLLGSGCETTNDPIVNHSVIPTLVGSEIFNVCVPAGTGSYTRYTVSVNAGGQTTTVNTEHFANRSDCDYSVDTADQVDPSAVLASESGQYGPGAQSSGAPGLSLRDAATASGSQFQPIDSVPYARPVPFLPAFSSSDAASMGGSCNPAASYYAVNHTNSTVTHLNACTLAAISTIPVYGNPLHPALTPDFSQLLVTSNDGAVNFINTSSDTVIATVLTPNMYPSGIAISPDGTTAYVTDYDFSSRLIVIDIPSRKITATLPLPYQLAKQVFLTPDGAQAWVNYLGNHVVSIVDTLSGTISGLVSTGGTAATGIAFNATGTRAYVATQPSDLRIFDTATLDQVADIQVGARPVDVVLSPDAARIYVTSFTSSKIAVIDTHTNKLLTTINAPAADQRAFVLIPPVP